MVNNISNLNVGLKRDHVVFHNESDEAVYDTQVNNQDRNASSRLE